MQVRNAHPFHSYKKQTTVSVKHRLLLGQFFVPTENKNHLTHFGVCRGWFAKPDNSSFNRRVNRKEWLPAKIPG